jgi:hypothetical protein
VLGGVNGADVILAMIFLNKLVNSAILFKYRIADTFVAVYRFEYRRYFLTLSNVDTFTNIFSFEFWFSSSLSMESVTQWGLQCTNCTVLVKP